MIKTLAKPWRRFVFTLAFAIVAIVAVLVNQPASGFKILVPHFDPIGILSADGQQAVMSYSYGCTTDERKPELQASVSQDSTHSLARDDPQEGMCTGEIRTAEFELTVVEGMLALEEGSALACGSGITTRRNGRRVTSSDAYCQFITLVRE